MIRKSDRINERMNLQWVCVSVCIEENTFCNAVI